jgi:hypothetical protein
MRVHRITIAHQERIAQLSGSDPLERISFLMRSPQQKSQEKMAL